MRKAVAWFLVFALLLAAYTAWPLIGLYRLASAVEQRNAARLSELIAFPSLRRSFAEQVIATYLKLTGKDAGLGKLSQAMVVGVTASVADPIVDRMINREVTLVINTPLGRSAFYDDTYIRRYALQLGIPCITTLSAAAACVEGIRAGREGVSTIAAIQEQHANRPVTLSRA